MVLVEQILGLVIIAVLVVWLVRRGRKRSERRYEELAPQPPAVAPIMAEAEVAESNGDAPEVVAEPTPPDPEPAELEAELKEIYDKVGQPDSFDEAKDKVCDLAAELVDRDGIDMNEALRIAYRRSLAEHREYLAAKGLA